MHVVERSDPRPGEPWLVGGAGFHIVEFWSNWPGRQIDVHKLFIEPGWLVRLHGGGAWWRTGCEPLARREFAGNRWPAITLAELVATGRADVLHRP